MKKEINSSSILIGGTGRSGTTMLTWLLNEHPHIASIKWESHFLVDENGLPAVVEIGEKALGKFLDKSKNFWWKREVKNINRPVYWAGLCDDINESIFFNALDNFSCEIRASTSPEERLMISRNFVNTIMNDFLSSQKKNRWAEKTPKNSIMIDFLIHLLPNTKIINIIRDGRDVVNSMVERQIWPIQANKRITYNRKGRKITIENSSYYWQQVLRYSRNLGNQFPNSYYEIKYENLINNTRNALELLAEFLNVPFHEGWLQYNINKNAIGKWKEKFTKKDISIFKENAGELLIELSYENDNNW